MDRRVLLTSLALLFAPDGFAQSASSPAQVVRRVLVAPEARLDFLQAKLTFDRIVDPSADHAAAARLVEGLASAARNMAGAGADDTRKLAAVRTLIYRSGAWNDRRPFAYDHSDPLGQNVRNKLLATYLRTRRGNCVSMPVLFLILADKLGVRVSLASAPLHILVRHVSPNGAVTNLETTSGALPARDAWYRQKMPMTNQAIASGAYLRTLSRRETAALMATTVMEHLFDQGRFQDAADVAAVILQASPRDAQTMVAAGSAYARMQYLEFEARYPTPRSIPRPLLPRYQLLVTQNRQMFARAEALGWREPS